MYNYLTQLPSYICIIINHLPDDKDLNNLSTFISVDFR